MPKNWIYRLLLFFFTFLVPTSGASYATDTKCPGWRDLNTETRIIGGKFTYIDKWPGLAALRFRDPKEEEAVYFCGATSVAPDWVLTAAHCVDLFQRDSKGYFMDTTGRYLEVVFGIDDLRRVTPSHIRQVVQIKIHHGYVPLQATKYGNDIAMLRLNRAWRGPQMPLSLSRASDPMTPPGARVIVAGFGLQATEKQGGQLKRFKKRNGKVFFAGSRELLETGLPTIAQKDCTRRYKGLKVGDGQVCAGFEQGGRDACQGDSGGPLIAFDAKGCPRQIGIVSWGDDCAKAKSYGVYTRTSYYRRWIAHNLPRISGAKVLSPRPNNKLVEKTVAQLQAVLKSVDGHVRIHVIGGDRVQLGSEISFELESDIAGRIVILDLDALGNVRKIIPNDYTKETGRLLIKIGEKIMIPQQSHGFDWFRAAEPVGSGYLIAIILPEEITGLSRGLVPERDPSRYLLNLLQQIINAVAWDKNNEIPIVGKWALGIRPYEIVK